MRSLLIHVQPNRSMGIDMQTLNCAFEKILSMDHLVKHHSFDHGEDDGPYSNYIFETLRAGDLWKRVRKAIYNSAEFGPHMKQASIATCSSEMGWDDYLLLFHFDPLIKLDSDAELLTTS